MIYQNLIKN